MNRRDFLIGTVAGLASLCLPAEAQTDEPHLKVPSMPISMDYCEKNNATQTNCFTIGEGDPQSHPRYIFDHSVGTIREQFPTPTGNSRIDNEYLNHVIYTSDKSGNLDSVLVVVDRRIGDQFVTRQYFGNGAYRKIDSRTGNELSLCIPDELTGSHPCSGSQTKKSKHILKDKKTADFRRYKKRFQTIQDKAKTLRK
jgi:hypothetical protein